MTPQLYAKLAAQAARQTTEAEDYEAQAKALQPGIDIAQSAVDSAQAAHDAIADDGDKTASMEALTAANADLAKVKAPQDALKSHAAQIRASIAQCDREMKASGITPDELLYSQQADAAEAAEAAEARRIAALWQAAHDYEFSQVSGSAIGLLAMGVMQGLPKCVEVQGWIKSIWTTYYTRKATGSHDTDFSGAGDCPHSVPSLMVELGV